MALPTVSIVGRPNVGKSSLLNMLAGRRISIVEPTAGVTRDRIQALCDHQGVYFEVVDTGGYGIADQDNLGEQVEQQIAFAVEQASLVLFVVDAREGLLPLDRQVADWLRGCQRPVLLLANKVDAPNTATELGDFHRLGYGPPIAVSAMHRSGAEEIKDWIVAHLPAGDTGVPDDPVMKIALVGRRNAGKSTLINALAGQERVIVSEIAGTTRDAVDVRFEHHGRVYMAIDTAGLRKKSRIADDVEYYSFHRAELSIRRADVVLFLLDATQEVGAVDKKLGHYIAEQYKPCVLVVNKWDLVKDRASTEEFGEYLDQILPGIAYAPVAFVTANQSKNVQTVIDLASVLFKQASTRVPTAQLNTVLDAVMSGPIPSAKRGQGAVKILYGTQAAVRPPTLILFVNDASRVSPGVERFLLGRLRDMLPFAEVPIRLVYRGRRGVRAAREAAERSGER